MRHRFAKVLPAWWNIPGQMWWHWQRISANKRHWPFFLSLVGMGVFITGMLLLGIADDWVY